MGLYGDFESYHALNLPPYIWGAVISNQLEFFVLLNPDQIEIIFISNIFFLLANFFLYIFFN